MARVVELTAPCRADLAGGTLDIWPLGLLHPGALTVNAALPVTVRLAVSGNAPAGTVIHVDPEGTTRTLTPADAGEDLTAAVVFALQPAGGIRVQALEQPPVGSGLGGSSAYGVTLAGAVLEFGDRHWPKERIVALVRDLEARLLATPTGVQDHWAAVLGGVLAVHLEPGGERVEPLDVDLEWLGERLLVFFTGITHRSGMVNWEVVRRRLDGDPATVERLEAIASAARACREALMAGDDGGVAAAIRAEWAARRELAPEVAPPELLRIVEAAEAAGAAAVKACGAGGGGSLLVWCPAGTVQDIVTALEAAAPAGRILCRGVERRGLTLVNGRGAGSPGAP